MFSFTQISRAKPSAPPVPDEEDTLQFFDAVIASCDSEPLRKPYTDDGHADVDFIGEPETPSVHHHMILLFPRDLIMLS